MTVHGQFAGFRACKLQPGVFSQDELDLVFSNITEIHKVHRQWLRDLKKASAPKKEEARLISEVFSIRDVGLILAISTAVLGTMPPPHTTFLVLSGPGNLNT